MFWGKLSCFQIRNEAKRETGGCQNPSGFRAGEVSGVTAGETQHASEWQAGLLGFRICLRKAVIEGGVKEGPSMPIKALVGQLCTHGELQNEEELWALETSQ